MESIYYYYRDESYLQGEDVKDGWNNIIGVADQIALSNIDCS